MLQNIQSYDPEQFAKTFKQTDLKDGMYGNIRMVITKE